MRGFRGHFDEEKLRELEKGLEQFLGHRARFDVLLEGFLENVDVSSERTEWSELTKRAVKNHALAQRLRTSRHLRKTADLANLLKLFIDNQTTVKEASRTLRIPIGRINYLLRESKTTHTQNLVTAWERFEKEGQLEDLFQERLAALLEDNAMKVKALRTIHVVFSLENPELPSLSFSEFYRFCRRYDFRHKALEFRQPYRERWSKTQKKFALLLSFELFVNVALFDVLWVDETTLCPGNFQKRGWGLKEGQLVVHSRLRYEGLKVLGVMSRDKVVALQFLLDGNSHVTFDRFLIEAINMHLTTQTERSAPVVFLDNANIRKSTELLAFCQRNRILMLFNLPYYPALNPIELLWRFLKLPFKHMVETQGK